MRYFHLLGWLVIIRQLSSSLSQATTLLFQELLTLLVVDLVVVDFNVGAIQKKTHVLNG